MEHRFLDSDVPMPDKPSFEALGHTGSGHYVGLETFPNPGCARVELTFDELMCKCPITGQPDFYQGMIVLQGTEKLIESKSLKLFFHNIIQSTWRGDEGLFGENLAVFIKETLVEVLGCEDDGVAVRLSQKSRGGISITAYA